MVQSYWYELFCTAGEKKGEKEEPGHGELPWPGST